MSYEEALKIFSLKKSFTVKEFKNSYYKLARNNHPDVVSDGSDRMKFINQAKIIIEKKLKENAVLDAKEKFRKEIEKLKKKYHDTEIYRICLIYEQNLDSLASTIDLEKERKDFYQVIDKLKKEIILPDAKKSQLEWLKKLGKGHEKEIEELTKKFLLMTESASSLEELNSIKQKYVVTYEKMNEIEKKQRVEYIRFKDSVKRSLIYHFYKCSYNTSISSVLLRYELLLSMLTLLEISTIDNIEEIYESLRKVDYNNVKEEISKFQLLSIKYRPNATVLDLKKITENAKKNSFIDVPLEKPKQELVNKMLENFYTKSTNKNTSIEKILKDREKFTQLMKKIQTSSLETIQKTMNFKETNWKRYEMILESVDDFLDPSQIYIERETGKICVLKEYNKKVYTIYLTGEVEKNVKEKSEIIWKYISLYHFFRVSYFTNGKSLQEVSSKNSLILFDYYSNDLYFTSDLLLRYIEKNGEFSFEFYPSKERFQFVLSENDQMVNNDFFKKYKDRDKCLMDLLLFIKKEQKGLVESKNTLTF